MGPRPTWTKGTAAPGERDRRVIELDEQAYRRLYDEVLLLAIRLTRVKDSSQEATRIDRACEATQRAFDRYLRVRPANLETLEQLRKYLAWSVRSELSNAKEEEAARRGRESAAAIEQATLAGAAGASAEVIYIEFATAKRWRERAARALRTLRRHLAGDSIALGTIDWLARGKTQPADQARRLGCSIEEIHAARKRRKRALEKVLAEIDGKDDEEKK
jgi:hypothetical protein